MEDAKNCQKWRIDKMSRKERGMGISVKNKFSHTSLVSARCLVQTRQKQKASQKREDYYAKESYNINGSYGVGI